MKKTIQHGVTYMTKSAPNWIPRTSRGPTAEGLMTRALVNAKFYP
ncbi:hypothetical protein CbuK_0296 [Coxiella burnetii CbuK_Q154]|nr:hypothetical protein CbuK_0296 [Coxiella burnetii CbuK_Q154]